MVSITTRQGRITEDDAVADKTTDSKIVHGYQKEVRRLQDSIYVHVALVPWEKSVLAVLCYVVWNLRVTVTVTFLRI